jgi:hypothetical protein
MTGMPTNRWNDWRTEADRILAGITSKDCKQRN